MLSLAARSACRLLAGCGGSRGHQERQLFSLTAHTRKQTAALCGAIGRNRPTAVIRRELRPPTWTIWNCPGISSQHALNVFAATSAARLSRQVRLHRKPRYQSCSILPMSLSTGECTQRSRAKSTESICYAFGCTQCKIRIELLAAPVNYRFGQMAGFDPKRPIESAIPASASDAQPPVSSRLGSDCSLHLSTGRWHGANRRL